MDAVSPTTVSPRQHDPTRSRTALNVVGLDPVGAGRNHLADLVVVHGRCGAPPSVDVARSSLCRVFELRGDIPAK